MFAARNDLLIEELKKMLENPNIYIKSLDIDWSGPVKSSKLVTVQILVHPSNSIPVSEAMVMESYLKAAIMQSDDEVFAVDDKVLQQVEGYRLLVDRLVADQRTILAVEEKS